MRSAPVGGLSRPPHSDPVGWSLEIDDRGTPLYPARLSALSRGLSTGRRRTLGPTPWRIWVGSDCPDWPLALSGAPECARDASHAAFAWGEHHRAQCDPFDATL